MTAELDKIKQKYGGSVWSMSYSDYKKYQKECNAVTKAIQAEIDWGRRNALGGGIGQLEDIYDALSGGKHRDSGIVIYGHGSKYYGSDPSHAASEILANYGSLSITRPDLIDMLRKDKPDLVTALDEAVKLMLQRVVL